VLVSGDGGDRVGECVVDDCADALTVGVLMTVLCVDDSIDVSIITLMASR
jgi:hypothetical protein